MVNPLPWIDASKAHLLARCALRWTAETTSDAASEERRTPESTWSAATLGIQAHKALEQWACSSQWREENPGELLRERFHILTASNTAGLGAARIIGSKLTARGRELADWLHANNCELLLPEEFVSDEQRRIRGGMDLVAVADHAVHIFDLKTGRGYARNRTLPESAVLQLAVYSVLATDKWKRPAKASILSLDSGLLDDQDHASGAAEILVKNLEEKRAAALATPTPTAVASPDACSWCALRCRCTVHWAAVESGVITDTVAGELERSTVSANGKVSVILSTSEGRQLVAGLDAAPNAPGGVQVAALRVNRVEGSPHVWHANGWSTIDLLDAF
ncbi:PD-(D/E)XK nuclease family protein [Mycolicibacterium mucogenicum]|uniref:PD-(D/E)XK nuclease family protein n=1 Tax=Mycolicibacterium mucogenicum DSM 44124 TaxID=1226753 RepID=A0A8E4W400_MYCMU|nr:PD-(D/E)XK nuclease family protein [Mycolicibacterium mucogenicum]QPG70732.1 PD-(D/E)XK nuclease family protein [Mycolicibacterium mucogenicum DSM 44124]